MPVVVNQLSESNLTGLAEAEDIYIHLDGLKWIIDDMEEGEFEGYLDYIRPLFMVICKIWAHSDYYRTPARLTVLLQEICNLMMSQVNYLFLFKMS